MRIYHLALAADWSAAQASGSYTTSTLGVTLEEEGFLHASRADQWEGVRQRFYADVTEPLVLLVIDTELLGVPVVEEVPAPGMTETFPHIYGPLDPAAVVEVVPLGGGTTASASPAAAPEGAPAAVAPTASFSRVFLGEMALNVGLALLVMVLVAVGILLGRGLDDTWGPWLGFVVGLGVGIPLAVALHRRRS